MSEPAKTLHPIAERARARDAQRCSRASTGSIKSLACGSPGLRRAASSKCRRAASNSPRVASSTPANAGRPGRRRGRAPSFANAIAPEHQFGPRPKAFVAQISRHKGRVPLPVTKPTPPSDTERSDPRVGGAPTAWPAGREGRVPLPLNQTWGPDGLAGGAGGHTRANHHHAPIRHGAKRPAGGWGPDGLAGGAGGARAPPVMIRTWGPDGLAGGAGGARAPPVDQTGAPTAWPAGREGRVPLPLINLGPRRLGRRGGRSHACESPPRPHPTRSEATRGWVGPRRLGRRGGRGACPSR